MRVLPGSKGDDSSSEEEDRGPETEERDDRPMVRVDASNVRSSRQRRDPMGKIRKGDVIDVCEPDGIWYPAEVKKLDLERKRLFVSFSEDAIFDKWVDAHKSVIAPLYTHTYDERGNFRENQAVEILDDRGVWRLGSVVQVLNDCVKVQFQNSNINDNEYITSPLKRIKTFRKGTHHSFRRWKVPGVSINGIPSSSASSSSSSSLHADDRYEDQENKPVDNRQRQIAAYSDRFCHYVEALGRQGLRVVSVSGDGNCLFRSVAHQVYGDDELHGLVRDRCMAYMEADSQFFSQFVEGGEATFPLYLQAKRRNGCWGDDPEIQVSLYHNHDI
jgi:hypothetical protein